VPGGTVELGETLEEALVREILEETAVRVVPREVATVFDRIQRSRGHVVYHYVIVDFICDYVAGVARPGSDADAVAWAAPEELARYDLPGKALEVVLDGFRRATILKRNIRRRGRTIDQEGRK
jgi:ADP-ribose pyrophosphatase YjhB (NUDIX family)